MVTHIFPSMLSNQFKRLVSARSSKSYARARWKLSFLARSGEKKIFLVAACLSRRETPQCGYCVNIWKPISFYSEEFGNQFHLETFGNIWKPISFYSENIFSSFLFLSL